MNFKFQIILPFTYIKVGFLYRRCGEPRDVQLQSILNFENRPPFYLQSLGCKLSSHANNFYTLQITILTHIICKPPRL